MPSYHPEARERRKHTTREPPALQSLSEQHERLRRLPGRHPPAPTPPSETLPPGKPYPRPLTSAEHEPGDEAGKPRKSPMTHRTLPVPLRPALLRPHHGKSLPPRELLTQALPYGPPRSPPSSASTGLEFRSSVPQGALPGRARSKVLLLRRTSRPRKSSPRSRWCDFPTAAKINQGRCAYTHFRRGTAEIRRQAPFRAPGVHTYTRPTGRKLRGSVRAYTTAHAIRI